MQRALASTVAIAVAALVAGCETSAPTEAVLDNAYVARADGTGVTVFKGWWFVASFLDPVPAGGESAAVRVVKGSDFAYALLAPGFTPNGGVPTALVPVRSHEKLTAARGDTLHVRVAPDTVDGDCASGNPLSQADADFITQRIFPSEFSGLAYDAATCTTTPLGEGGTGGEGTGAEVGAAGSGGASGG